MANEDLAQARIEVPVNRGLPRSTAAALAVAVGLVGLVGVGSLWAFRQVEDAAIARTQAQTLLGSARGLGSALVDAETAQRGFALTGDEAYLEPYLGVRERVGANLTDLSQLASSSVSRKHADVLTPLVGAKLEHMARVVDLSRAGDLKGAVALIKRGDGKRLMDSIRVEITSFIEIEEGTLAQREAAFQSSLGVMLGLIGLASLVGVFLALASSYFLVRDSRQREKSLVHHETRHLLEAQEALNQTLRAANETLRDGEEKLSVTLNSIGDAVIATDGQGEVTRLNLVGEQLTGWTQVEALGRPVADIFRIIHKDTREPAVIPVLETLSKGVVHGLANHTVLISRQGSECDIADSCAPIRGHSGQVVGAVLIFRDVTADYKVQQALRDSTTFIETILKNVSDGMMTIHAQGGLVERVNAAAETMFGYAAAEMSGQPLSALIPELGSDSVGGSLEYYAASDSERARGLGREVTGRRKDGTLFPVEISVTEMWLGGVRYFTGVLRDITARREVQVERDRLDLRLRDQQFYTRSLIESSIDALMTTDASGIVTDANAQMEILTGCTRDELIGAPFKRHFTDPTRAQEGIDLVLAEKKVRNYELTARARDGRETPVSYNAATFYDRDRKLQGVFAAARDISDRKRQDLVLVEKSQELEKAKTAAEKANQAKSDFLSSMSHELRTPLNAILGFAQLMESGSPPPTPSQRRSIDQIQKGGWYLLELINEILDLALIESGRVSLSLEPVALGDVLRECRSMIEPQARKRGLHLAFSELKEQHFVRADRTRLKQVFINLLSNALKYNSVGGTVGLECVEVSPGRIRIRVIDQGAGLSAEKLAHLFQPFNRLGKEAGAEEGTGIGLVVSKRLVELMGGAIGASSAIGQGSEFWVDLDLTAAPVSEAVPPHHLMSVTAPDPSALGTHTLLYVEDNPANLMLVEDLVARLPSLRLLSATDGPSGLEMARASLPRVILMDVNLPGMSGVTAMQILAKDPATAHIPVIAISANALPRDIEKGIQAGFFRYLTKPLRVNEFMETLDVALTFAKTQAARTGERTKHDGQ